ncbi:hypothetical protein QR98_0073180 [Sarcoptes scabiei]|uniref:EF-hand domain-containing protein n=1 Tax=Sarcoptes scabiei TaxID=52283 RepID=A0A132ACZ5_SARSC|nr:hypothetical protein QR98_0073180 [Sarcoptes scabiei]
MFDFNGDGQVEYEEFAKVQNAILAQTSHGRKLGKSNRYKGLSSAVSRYFFGENLDRRLSIDEFVRFQESLQKELLMLEFERKNPDPLTNRISEIDFADLLVVYAQFSQRKKQRMNQRLRTRFSKRISPNDNDGISFDDYLDFFHFLKNINDVDIALAMYNIAGVSIDQGSAIRKTFKHVAKSVANVDLPDYLLVLIFLIFDDDEDGQLSHKEFIAIMKERLRRGLSRPKDTGLLSILSINQNV